MQPKTKYYCINSKTFLFAMVWFLPNLFFFLTCSSFADVSAWPGKDSVIRWKTDFVNEESLQDILPTKFGENSNLVRMLDSVFWDALMALFYPSVAPVPPPVPPPVSPPVSPPTVEGFEDVLINCGGDAYTDTQGRVWKADEWFDGGNVYSSTATDISATADDTVSVSKSAWRTAVFRISNLTMCSRFCATRPV
jgi:hypothetical protein